MVEGPSVLKPAADIECEFEAAIDPKGLLAFFREGSIAGLSVVGSAIVFWG